MKADYKNWMPKGMVASFIGGTAGALAIVPAARLLMPEGPAKSVVTAVSAAAVCAFGGASVWSYLMYRAFDYNGTRQMSKQIISMGSRNTWTCPKAARAWTLAAAAERWLSRSQSGIPKLR